MESSPYGSTNRKTLSASKVESNQTFDEMDFRSQLSAFKNKSSNSSESGSRDVNSDRGRGNSGNYHGNNNNYNNSYRHGSPNHGGGDGGGRRDGGYGGDRRRHRPREWNQGSNYHHGPPTARRRFHPPRHGSPGHGYDQGPGYGQSPPNLDGLGEIRNLGYRIPRGFPPAPTEEEKKKKSKHLALLAISIEDLPYEDIWKGWCEALSSSLGEEADDFYISLVCHAKFPQNVESKWLRQRLLTHPPKQGRGNSYMNPDFLSRTPKWGSVEITRAMLDLLQDGLKIGNADNTAAQEDKRFCASRYLVRSPPSFNASDSTNVTIPPVDQFLFVSESCIPVVTATELFSRVSDSNISWLNARHRTEADTPKNKYEDDQFAGINRRIPGQYRWKGDQWVLLARRHASSIIGMDRPFKPPKHQLWQSFRHINASDEMFFPTALALLGDLRYTKDGYDTQKGRNRDEEFSQDNPGSQKQTNAETDSTNAPTTTPSTPPKNECIVLKPVTYTDWTEGMKNPATFTKGPIDLKRVGKLARDMGCLMARKFATHIKIPGTPLVEQKITGFITVEQWESVIKEIQSQEEKTKVTVQEGTSAMFVQSDDGNLGTTEINEKKNCKPEVTNDDVDNKNLESGGQVEGDDNGSGEPEDNDDEENQLE